MKITLTMQNPHDSQKPTRLVSSGYETLDDIAQAVYFFYEYCQVISVSVKE